MTLANKLDSNVATSDALAKFHILDLVGFVSFVLQVIAYFVSTNLMFLVN